MRGILSVLALTAAICGMLVVIAYAASDAYLNFRDQETDLNSSLLLGTLAPEGWTASVLPRTEFNEHFLSPCLAVPLLDGVGASGRGAQSYGPSGAPAGVQLRIIETSRSDAGAVMDSARRDTENNCQRGLTVGTVAGADVKVLTNINADEAILVDLSRRQNGELVDFTEAIIRDGNYIVRLSYEHDPATAVDSGDVAAMAAGIVERIENPPTEAELEAAGALPEPLMLDRAAERLQTDSNRGLSLEGRISPFVGIGVVGGLVVLLFSFGTRLNRSRGTDPRPAGAASGEPGTNTRPTLDNYGGSRQRWIRKSAHASESDHFLDDLDDEDFDPESSPPPPIPEPSPVLDFPQRSIDEKLKILKEARMRAPRPEFVAPSTIVPAVDWTEEISKPETKPVAERVAPPEQISPRALLKKLRTEQSD